MEDAEDRTLQNSICANDTLFADGRDAPRDIVTAIGRDKSRGATKRTREVSFPRIVIYLLRNAALRCVEVV